MRNDRERLLHIQDAIERIDKYAQKGKEAFSRDELIQSWILRHLQIIGEACRALSPEFKARHSDVPWSDIIGMRNILVHDYFGIDVEAVWSAVERDLPELKRKIDAILRAMNKKS